MVKVNGMQTMQFKVKAVVECHGHQTVIDKTDITAVSLAIVSSEVTSSSLKGLSY